MRFNLATLFIFPFLFFSFNVLLLSPAPHAFLCSYFCPLCVIRIQLPSFRYVFSVLVHTVQQIIYYAILKTPLFFSLCVYTMYFVHIDIAHNTLCSIFEQEDRDVTMQWSTTFSKEFNAQSNRFYYCR